MDPRTEILKQKTITLLKSENYLVSEDIKDSQSCFDIAVRKDDISFLLKIMSDIDNLQEIQASELKILSKILSTKPLIIGEKTRKGRIEDGVVYQRFSIPAINLRTLYYVIKKNLFPVVYAKRGGYYVKLNSSLLRAIREKHSLSLKDIADMLGVTRKTVYEYERGSMDSTLNTASKLEEIFDMVLTVPIDILNWEFKEPDQKYNFVSKLQKFVNRILIHLGLTTVCAQTTPFQILASKEAFKLLTSLDEPKSENLSERLKIIESLSKIMESYPILVVHKECDEKLIDNIPVITKRELKEIEKLEILFKIIEDRLRN
ncbi:MAG: transcriptional regulator [Candidatus Odinarchaeia archaeon]